MIVAKAIQDAVANHLEIYALQEETVWGCMEDALELYPEKLEPSEELFEMVRKELFKYLDIFEPEEVAYIKEARFEDGL